LARLTEANLLVEYAPGRWTLHDLLRTYATELAETTDSQSDRQSALHRLLDHYLHTAYAATLLLDPHRPPAYTPAPSLSGVVSIELRTHRQATNWLAIEEATLFKAIEHASVTGFDIHTWQLANCLNVFSDRRGLLSQLLGIQRIGLLAAERLGDRLAEAMANSAMGIANSVLGNYDEALNHLRRSLGLRRELGDVRGEAMVNVNFAWHWYRQQEWTEALLSSHRALDLFRTVDDRAWQGRTLNMVAWCYTVCGDHEQAVTCCEQALALQQEVGDTTEEGFTWDSLGYAHHQLGDHQRSAVSSRPWRSLTIATTDAAVPQHCTTSAMPTTRSACGMPLVRRGWPRCVFSGRLAAVRPARFEPSWTDWLVRPGSASPLGGSGVDCNQLGNSLGSLPTHY
jgi:tetratricopeptide (TPR) repeat protein